MSADDWVCISLTHINMWNFVPEPAKAVSIEMSGVDGLNIPIYR